jgi:purine-binding chemotaxis protein CheW
MNNATILDAAAIQRILEERAAALARSAADDHDPVKTIPLVELSLGAERFGIDLQQVQEIQPLKGLTRVPGVAAHWAGVVNLRGRLYPVLDLRHVLGLAASDVPVEGQIIVAAAVGLEVALWANDVLGVRHIPHDAIGPPPLETGEGSRAFISGVTAELLSVLDLDVILSDPGLAAGEPSPKSDR